MAEETSLTRREIGLGALAALNTTRTASVRAAAFGPTAADIAARVRSDLSATWKDSLVDGFSAGDPTIAVNGVAVTAMPNFVTLSRAVAQGCNMVVSLESPLYARPYTAATATGPGPSQEQTVAALRADPTYAEKLAYIAEHRLAVYRLDDNLRAHRPQPLVQAVAETMGWSSYRSPEDERLFSIPRTSLQRLASAVKRGFGANGGMRVIGKPDMLVSRILVVPGRVDPVVVVKALPHVDVLLTGDLREWELVEYIHDSWESGPPKALLAVGRIHSEQPGMLAAASWLRGIAGVPVKPIMAEDPYWRLPA